MNPKIQRSMPIVLTIASIIGVGATSYLVAKETEKNIDKLRDSKSNKKKYFKAVLKSYTPAIAVATATVASMAAGTIISKKTEASLSATCIMLDRSLRRYKGKIKEKLGEKAEEIEKSICFDEYETQKNSLTIEDDGMKLYYEDHVGFFKARPENLQEAITKMNERILDGEAYCSLKMFLKDMKAEICNKDVDDVSYDYGWTYDYIQESFVFDGYGSFVHPKLELVTDDEGEVQYYMMSFDKEPIFGVTDIMKYGGYTTKEIERIQEEMEHDQELKAYEYNIKDLEATKKLEKELKNEK